MTNVASIRWNDITELESGLLSIAVSLRKKDVTDKLVSGLVTNLTYTTNLASISSFLTFPINKLSFNLHCITCIDFTYHSTLWKNHAIWIKSILPLLQLLISSFHLKYIFLFSHQPSNDPCPLEPLVPLIQSVISSLNISTHTILTHHLGNNVSCSRSFLYLSPLKILSPSFFIPKSTPSFPNPTLWLSSTFNSSHFSPFTTTNFINTFPLATPSPLFFHPTFKAFIQQ